VLVTVSGRTRQVLRDGDTLARKGGDEFVAVLVDLDDVSDAIPLLNRLLAAAAQAMPFKDLSLQVSASIGICFYSQTQLYSAEELMHQADLAMYQAKLAGKNQYCVFAASDITVVPD